MGRPEKPVDPDAGPVQRLAWQLRRLRERAGNPSYRRLAQRAHYSASTLAEAAKGDRLASLEVTLAYVEACGGDPVEWRARWSAAAEAVARSGPARRDEDEEPCPYRGLTAFQPEDADWFFGRAELVDRLLDRVRRLPLIGLFGASGSGKSSLLRAGLLGTIERDGRWRVLLMTPTEHPVHALADVVAKLSAREVDRMSEELFADPAALDIAVRSVLAAGPAETRALLVVDQFEEVFTLCADEAERGRFIDALLDATRGPEGRTTVVLGVRADFLAHVTRYPRLLEALADEAQLLVGPMSAADLREIITRPAARVGLDVEPELVTTVLADAAGQAGALPLVSHALLETWHRRTGPTLTLAAYQASGGVRGAIAQTAERIHADLDADQRAVARRIFLRLTALGDGTQDTRRPIARTELDGIADEAVTADVLARLAQARLVVLGSVDGRGTVDVAHEALIRAWPRLHRWLTDDRAGLILHRRLTDAAHTWQSLDRDSGALFRGAQLYGAQAFAEDHPGELNQLESSFLRASTAQAEAEQDSARRRTRLLNRLVAGVSVLLVLAIVGGSLAILQRQQARRQQLAALADGLSLQARSLLATDPELAGLLAVEANRLSPSTETRGGVLSAAAVERRTRLNVGGPPVQSVAFSPDHSLLAAAAGNGSVDLWDPVRGVRVAELTGHSGRSMRVAFNGDGSRLASTAADGATGSIIVWDVGTRRPVTRLAENGITAAMAFSADGSKLAVGVGRGNVVLHDLVTGSRRELTMAGRSVTSLSFSADARLLASADGVAHPRVWQVSTGAVLADLPAEHVFSVFFGPTGHILAGSADESGVYLWDLGGVQPVVLPTGARGVPDGAGPLRNEYAWAVSAPVGDRIAVSDENGTIALWDFRRGVRLQTFQDRGRTETRSVALSPDGAMLASAGFNGTIVVHDLHDNPFGGFDAQVRDLKVSPDGDVVAVAGSDRTVRLWDPHGRLLATLGGHADEVQAVAFSPDGRLLAALTRNITITIWDVQRHQPATASFPAGGIGASTDIAFDSSGGLLASATLGTYVWDVRDPTAPADITSRYQGQFSTSLTFSPDGRRLLSANVAGFLNVWDTATGELVARHDTRQGALQDLAVGPDGRLVATAGDDRTVKLWDATTLDEVATLSGHTAPIQVVAFSRDGRTLATAGDDQTVRLWDVPTRTHVATLDGHGSRIRGLAFTQDGALLSGGEDGRIIRWSLDAAAATDRLCSSIGRSLTQQEWAAYLSPRPYGPTCGPSA